MPLDDFQVRIARLLSPSRSPSVLVDDDVRTLRDDGLDVTVTKRFEGFAEVVVSGGDEGRSVVQWVAHSQRHFFAPVPDDVLGWRLHHLDLVTNKVLACAQRREPRDYVDLATVHGAGVPIWAAAWAAVGKQVAFTPHELLDRISHTNSFAQDEMDRVVSLVPLSASEIARAVMDGVEEARAVLPSLDPRTAGRFLLGSDGLWMPGGAPPVRTVAPRPGPVWFEFPALDDRLVSAMADAVTPDPPGPTDDPFSS